MKQTAILAATLGGAAYLVSGLVSPASAAIKCRGNLQHNSAVGGWIGSSYCSDNLVAAVARSHGMKVTNKQVRQNPNIKADACRFAGSDIRIQDWCAGDLHEDTGGDGKD